MAKKLIFVDTETTGLDATQDELVELSYADLYGPVRTLYFGVEKVSPFIDEFIGFTRRGIAGRKSTQAELDEFFRMSENNTMVAANPAFDKAFLEANDLFRFHYRMLDIESFGAKALNTAEVPGMKEIHEALTNAGYTMHEPNHTSRSDVLALRDAYNALRAL